MISSKFRWYQLLKKIFGPYLGLFRPKFGPKFGIGSNLYVDSYNLSDITHSDFILWFLNYETIKGLFSVKKAFQLYMDIDLYNICLNAC